MTRITAQTLLDWGYSPGRWFKRAIEEGDRIRRHGGDERAIRQAIEFYVGYIDGDTPEGFYFSEDEQKQIEDWNKKHDKHCPIIKKAKKWESPYGAIAGGRTYQFTPTSIGTIISVKCACGADFMPHQNL